MSTILSITEFTDRRKSTYGQEDGFEIVCDDQTVTLAIDSYQSCCEQWGYFMSEDDVDKFVGADLLGVAITDTTRSTRELPGYGLDEGEAMFVDLRTSLGTLQFVAYNAHNGYYGHTARVESKALDYSVTL